MLPIKGISRAPLLAAVFPLLLSALPVPRLSDITEVNLAHSSVLLSSGPLFHLGFRVEAELKAFARPSSVYCLRHFQKQGLFSAIFY